MVLFKNDREIPKETPWNDHTSQQLARAETT